MVCVLYFTQVCPPLSWSRPCCKPLEVSLEQGANKFMPFSADHYSPTCQANTKQRLCCHCSRFVYQLLKKKLRQKSINPLWVHGQFSIVAPWELGDNHRRLSLSLCLCLSVCLSLSLSLSLSHTHTRAHARAHKHKHARCTQQIFKEKH